MKKNSWESLKRKLKQITKKTKPYGFEERLKKLVPMLRERGWVNNYRPRNSGQALPVSKQSLNHSMSGLEMRNEFMNSFENYKICE